MENFVDRALVAMARIKDASSPLDSKVAGAIAIKYADAFILTYRPDLLFEDIGTPEEPNLIPRALVDIPNEEKAQAYINQIRKYHKEVLAASRLPSVAEAARVAEGVVVDTEFPIDFGTEE